jgi:adenosylcobinamide kinase/adenosylcobinamide-phosphate guanylyltransferase
MLALIFGGSGSGKSTYGEDLAVQLAGQSPLYYLATMISCDGECSQRIARHRQQRAGKGFRTIEQAVDLYQCVLAADGTVLLECLSTWLTNEMYRGDAVAQPQQKIWSELQTLQQRCQNLLVISNDIFADGMVYDGETEIYRQHLDWLHRQLAQRADMVVEVVVGLPILQKGVLL